MSTGVDGLSILVVNTVSEMSTDVDRGPVKFHTLLKL